MRERSQSLRLRPEQESTVNSFTSKPQNPDQLPTPQPEEEVADRLQRLEDVVAILCDTKQLEERIVQQVTTRMTQTDILLPPVESLPKRAIVDQVEAPPLMETRSARVERPSSPPVATLAEFQLPPIAPKPTPPSLTSKSGPAMRLIGAVVPESSLLRDILWDMRMLTRLLRDPGYVTTWTFRIVPLLSLFLVLVWPKLSPFIGWMLPAVQLGIFSIVVDLILLYVSYKIVDREIRRYYEFCLRYRS